MIHHGNLILNSISGIPSSRRFITCVDVCNDIVAIGSKDGTVEISQFALYQTRIHHTRLAGILPTSIIYNDTSDNNIPKHKKITSIKISPCHKFIAFGNASGEIFVFDIQDIYNGSQSHGHLIASHFDHKGFSILSLCWSPNSEILCSGCSSGRLIEWIPLNQNKINVKSSFGWAKTFLGLRSGILLYNCDYPITKLDISLKMNVSSSRNQLSKTPSFVEYLLLVSTGNQSILFDVRRSMNIHKQYDSVITKTVKIEPNSYRSKAFASSAFSFSSSNNAHRLSLSGNSSYNYVKSNYASGFMSCRKGSISSTGPELIFCDVDGEHYESYYLKLIDYPQQSNNQSSVHAISHLNSHHLSNDTKSMTSFGFRYVVSSENPVTKHLIFAITDDNKLCIIDALKMLIQFMPLFKDSIVNAIALSGSYLLVIHQVKNVRSEINSSIFDANQDKRQAIANSIPHIDMFEIIESPNMASRFPLQLFNSSLYRSIRSFQWKWMHHNISKQKFMNTYVQSISNTNGLDIFGLTTVNSQRNRLLSHESIDSADEVLVYHSEQSISGHNSIKTGTRAFSLVLPTNTGYYADPDYFKPNDITTNANGSDNSSFMEMAVETYAHLSNKENEGFSMKFSSPLMSPIISSSSSPVTTPRQNIDDQFHRNISLYDKIEAVLNEALIRADADMESIVFHTDNSCYISHNPSSSDIETVDGLVVDIQEYIQEAFPHQSSSSSLTVPKLFDVSQQSSTLALNNSSSSCSNVMNQYSDLGMFNTRCWNIDDIAKYGVPIVTDDQGRVRSLPEAVINQLKSLNACISDYDDGIDNGNSNSQNNVSHNSRGLLTAVRKKSLMTIIDACQDNTDVSSKIMFESMTSSYNTNVHSVAWNSDHLSKKPISKPISRDFLSDLDVLIDHDYYVPDELSSQSHTDDVELKDLSEEEIRMYNALTSLNHLVDETMSMSCVVLEKPLTSTSPRRDMYSPRFFGSNKVESVSPVSTDYSLVSIDSPTEGYYKNYSFLCDLDKLLNDAAELIQTNYNPSPTVSLDALNKADIDHIKDISNCEESLIILDRTVSESMRRLREICDLNTWIEETSPTHCATDSNAYEGLGSNHYLSVGSSTASTAKSLSNRKWDCSHVEFSVNEESNDNGVFEEKGDSLENVKAETDITDTTEYSERTSDSMDISCRKQFNHGTTESVYASVQESENEIVATSNYSSEVATAETLVCNSLNSTCTVLEVQDTVVYSSSHINPVSNDTVPLDQHEVDISAQLTDHTHSVSLDNDDNIGDMSPEWLRDSTDVCWLDKWWDVSVNSLDTFTTVKARLSHLRSSSSPKSYTCIKSSTLRHDSIVDEFLFPAVQGKVSPTLSCMGSDSVKISLIVPLSYSSPQKTSYNSRYTFPLPNRSLTVPISSRCIEEIPTIIPFEDVCEPLVARSTVNVIPRPMAEDVNEIMELFVNQPPPDVYEVSLIAPQGLGMQLQIDPNGLVVINGFRKLINGEKGPAELCGLISIGDHLISLNGK